MKNLKKTLSLLASLSLAACGAPIETVSFKDGLPSKEIARVDAPKSAQQRVDAMAGVGQQALGDVAGTWLVTGGTVLVVNGITLWTLGSLHFVAGFEPSSDDGNTAVWGPHTNEWERTTWKLTAVRTAPNAFRYTLEAKAKGTADTEYAPVITGSHTVAVDDDGKALRGYGEGQFIIDYDKAARLPTQESKRGRATFRYTRPSETEATTVQVDLSEFSGDATRPTTASYRYSQVPGGEGSFEFSADANIHWFDSTKTALERWSIKSRWLASGAGRADVRATGGDLTGPSTVSECWDTRFASTYLDGSDATQQKWGTASSCAYTSASYAR